MLPLVGEKRFVKKLSSMFLFFVSTSTIECPEGLIAAMTYYVLNETLNSVRSLST